MNRLIYKISFELSSFELNEEYEKLSDYEKERISELDADSFFDYNEDDKYICFIMTNPVEIKKYISILNSNLIWCDCKDISREILSFKLDLESELRNISVMDSIKFSFFIDDIKEWILENLDIDMVLDRISEVGIESLTRIEKEFLKKYKQVL